MIEIKWSALCAGILLLWNLAGFILMGMDKRRARRNEWRVPERVFFFFAFCFGGVGILAGMRVFHHKTQHLSFRIGVPAGILLDGVLIFMLAAPKGWISALLF